ncbi:nucleotide disphospho-sugar-binding domain-containing protein [Mycolicibacterium hodleri]|uniref:Glycosyltransferase n=1 Tax=Mycolicibacterium hodleri TaxID=49897 RepID=A0A502DKC7_9MYCO|nr:nucleotide disphospho-sugar-binding domain-containing protein [Mycolicibacterium hodleri]TPG25222.1 glycosyltransferase [Mycolicibacterium hodleri]
MSTIAAYTSPALGHLYPMIAVLLELQSRGHRIVIKTLAEGVPLAQSLGFDATAIDPRIDDVAMQDWMAPNARRALDATMAVFGARALYEIDDAREVLDTYRPDAMIIDANCWGAASVADAAGLSWATFWPYTPFLRSRGVPPFGPGLAPWPGMPGRLRDGLLRPLVTGALERAMLSSLSQVRTAAQAPSIQTSDEFLCRAKILLVATSHPFEYEHPDWGSQVHLVGPCEYDPAPSEPPSWLADIDRPIVLVSTSTEYQDDGALAVTAIGALAAEPLHLVVTCPSGPPALDAVPSNATVTRFAPHGMILDRAVCAITHGGMGSTQKALARGVPVCAVPHGRDQFEVGRRVQVARCGTRLPARKLTTGRLQRAVNHARTMTDGARRVAEGYRAAGGPTRAADLVERHLL